MIQKNSATIMYAQIILLKGKINFYNRKFGFAIVDKKNQNADFSLLRQYCGY